MVRIFEATRRVALGWNYEVFGSLRSPAIGDDGGDSDSPEGRGRKRRGGDGGTASRRDVQCLLCVIQMHLLPSTPYTLSHLGGPDYNLLYALNDPYMHQHHVNKCTGNGCIALHPASALIAVH